MCHLWYYPAPTDNNTYCAECLSGSQDVMWPGPAADKDWVFWVGRGRKRENCLINGNATTNREVSRKFGSFLYSSNRISIPIEILLHSVDLWALSKHTHIHILYIVYEWLMNVAFVLGFTFRKVWGEWPLTLLWANYAKHLWLWLWTYSIICSLLRCWRVRNHAATRRRQELRVVYKSVSNSWELVSVYE